MTKTCSKCKAVKELAEFQKDKGKASGYKSSCKECANEVTRAYKAVNSELLGEKKKAYREANPEKEKATHKAWYEKNKESEKAKALERYYAKRAE